MSRRLRTVYVGIERVHQILKFDFGRHGLLARGQPIPLPPEIKSLPYNKGLEALVVIPRGGPLGGTLLAVSERGLDPAGNIMGFLIGGPSPGIFAVRRTDNYDVTDAALLPDGDLLILERRASFLQGLSMRIRRVALGTPYEDALGERLRGFLLEAGFEPGSLVNLGYNEEEDVIAASPLVVEQLARAALFPGAEAVFLACTNLPTVGILDRLSVDLGVPVLSANQVLMEASVRRLERADGRIAPAGVSA